MRLVERNDMNKINKILLVVDPWMLQYEANVFVDGLDLEGADVIFFHVADYSEALASAAELYSETTLPGVGIPPASQFVAARERMIDEFARRCPQGSAPVSVDVEVHPQPAAKISSKAKNEDVDLVVIGIPQGTRECVYKRSIAERVLQQTGCLVLTVPVNATVEARTDQSATVPMA